MPSILRQLRHEWNQLVPVAQARGIRGVRFLAYGVTHESIAVGQRRLARLRAQLGHTVAPIQTLQSAAIPVTTVAGEQTFGCELEFVLPAGRTLSDAAQAVTSAGVECHLEMYGHSTPRTWKVVTDISVSGGGELVSPPLSGEAGFAQLRTACDALTAFGATVNASCGFHVHVGARNEGVSFFKHLVRLFAASQDAMDTVLAPSRRHGNAYCRRLRVNNVDSAVTVRDAIVAANGPCPSSDRYYNLNLTAYWRHSTVEFRAHQGTLDATKSVAWVQLCLGMCRAARAGATADGTLEGLLVLADLQADTRSYFTQRRAHFAVREQRRAA